MSTEKINAISIKNTVYDIEDKAAIHQPLTTPAEGSVLTYKNSNITWELITPSKDFDRTYYTAFEVMPNAETITAGTLSDIVYEKETLAYLKEVPACTIHKMTLRSHQEPADCDVVIDWGDGTVEAIRDLTWTSENHSVGKSYELSHDYSTVASKDENGQWRKFIVKIYGKNYYTFRHNSYKNNNLVSRAFDVDLPVASHIGNFASMLYGAKRILSVKFPHSASPYSDVWNWSSCFSYCINAQYIFGFEDINLKATAHLNGLFEGCNSLTDTDFKYPAGITEITTTFAQCYRLQKNLAKFFPKYGFASAVISITAPFYACNSATLEDVTGAIPVNEVLWNSETTKWIVVPWKTSSGNWLPFSSAFTNATNAHIKSTIPVSWGGTLAD